MTLARRPPVRTFLLVALAASVGVISSAASASADVSITPTQAVQGDSADLTFRITNDRPGTTTTKVRVEFPTDAPIAEVYPMSVDGWAPQATTRQADQPLQGIHSSDVTEITTAITWVRADGAPPAGPAQDLRVDLGPVPKVNQVVFTVVQTYSDGAVRRWHGPSASGPGTVLTVGPAAAGASGGSMAGMDMGGMSPAEMNTMNQGTAPATTSALSTGNGMIDILAGILGGALVTLVAGALIASRIRKDAATSTPREGTTAKDDPTAKTDLTAKDDPTAKDGATEDDESETPAKELAAH